MSVNVLMLLKAKNKKKMEGATKDLGCQEIFSSQSVK